MLEAVVALGLVSLVALAMLSVSLSIQTQTRVAQSGTAARSVAEDLFEVSRAAGCGLQTGAEPVEVLAGVEATDDSPARAGVLERCVDAWAAVTGGDVGPQAEPGGPVFEDLVFGDVVITGIDRSGVTYRAELIHRWLPFTEFSDPETTELSTEEDLVCSDLASMHPAALQRRVTVSWPESGDRALVATELEALAPDAAANDPGFGSVLLSGLVASSVVDLALPDDAGVLRRSAATFGDGACVWFPMLAPGEYSFEVLGGEVTVVEVSAGTTSLVDMDLVNGGGG
jgi:hypothetical protein